MFINSKYSKWYYNLIQSRKAIKRYRLPRNHHNYQYFELHHIIPKSLGGSNDKDNLVLLTPKEHFICHLLLIKMVTDIDQQKMIYALNITLNCSYKRCNSLMYSNIRRKVSLLVSSQFKGIKKSKEQIQKMVATRKKNGSYKHTAETKLKIIEWQKHNRKPCSEETKKKRSESLKGRKQSPEHIAKLSAARKGRTPWNKGLKAMNYTSVFGD